MFSSNLNKTLALRIGGALLALAAVLVLVLPSAVDAHTAHATATCGSVSITWANFTPAGPGNEGNGGKNSPSWTVTFTPASGGAPVTLTNQPPVSFSGSGTTLVVPIPAVDGSVTGSTSWTSAQTTNGVSGSMTLTSPIVIDDCPTTTTTTTTRSSSSTTSSTVTTTASTSTSATSTSSTVSTPTTSVSTTPTTATSSSSTVSANTTTAATTAAGAVLGANTTIPCVDTAKTVVFSRSKAGNVMATVTGTKIKRVAFYVDGRWVKTLSTANVGSHGYRYTVTVSKLRYGLHRVSVTYVGACASHTASTRFAHNLPARLILPRFTG